MTDTQLYLAIGIPSFLVVLALVTNLVQSYRLADRIDRLSEKNDRQIEKLAEKIDRIADQHHKDVLMLMEQVVALNDRMAKIESR